MNRQEARRPVVCLVCGSRNWTDRAQIREWLSKLPPGSVIVHGAAQGADTIAGEEARDLGFVVHEHPARWEQEGKAAGPLRNQRMLDEERPDVALAFTWALRGEGEPMTERPGITPGTGDMVLRCVAAGVRVTIVPPKRLDVQSLMLRAEDP